MLELAMATMSGEEAATGSMLMADAPSEPGAVLRVGRDKSVCRVVTPDDWMFVSPVHLEFVCDPEGTWQVTCLRDSQADPSCEVRIVMGHDAQSLVYGGTVALPRGCHGEVVIQDSAAPRSVNLGFYHEL